MSVAEIHWKSEKLNKVSSEAHDLVQEMLQVYPEQQPSILDILNHPWMNDIAVSEKFKTLYFPAGLQSSLAAQGTGRTNRSPTVVQASEG